MYDLVIGSGNVADGIGAQARMADVEDIPGAVQDEGINWEWESFPEYLDVLNKFPRSIDITAQVPHCAVRTYVMGERSVNNELATAQEVEKMAAIVKEGIEAGTLGFTTARTEMHMTRQVTMLEGENSAISLADTGAHCGGLLRITRNAELIRQLSRFWMLVSKRVVIVGGGYNHGAVHDGHRIGRTL